MPPKPKYSKDQIVAAALEVVAKKGLDALTAKELSAALGTSTSPIFTVFNSMQEVQEAVRVAAMQRFEDYAHRMDRDMPVFKQVGMQMILFAREEPRLYQLCFMSSVAPSQSFGDVFGRLGGVAQQCLEVIQRDYALSEADARSLFEHVWIHTFGIGALCATGMCDFSMERIAQMLSEDFSAMMLRIQSGHRAQSPASGEEKAR